jgi:hypothetical protein
VYTACECVQQVFIHGTSRHSKVIAIVVLPTNAEKDAKKDAEKDAESILAAFRRAASVAKLRHFEVPPCVHIVRPTKSAKTAQSAEKDTKKDAEKDAKKDTKKSPFAGRFTADNGMLTQSGKLCRWKIREVITTIAYTHPVSHLQTSQSTKLVPDGTLLRCSVRKSPRCSTECDSSMQRRHNVRAMP